MNSNPGSGRRARLSAAISAALGISLAGVGAQAQETGEAIEEIVVTGSFLYTGVESPSPVTVLGGEDIRAAAPADLLTFFFDNVPQNFSGDIGAQTGTQGQPRVRGGGRNATLNLRGIGNENTLSVLNGRRTIAYPGVDGQGWPTVSVNSIVPRIAISRVETLLDGGSAIFGSDPVAGVVNFITNNQFRGFDVTYDKRINEEVSDAANDVLGVMWGGGNERTNIVIAGEFSKTDRIFADQTEGDNDPNPNVTPETGTGLDDLFGLNYDAAMGLTWVDPDCGNPALGAPLRAGYPSYEDADGDFRVLDAANPIADACSRPQGFNPSQSIQQNLEQNVLFVSIEHQFSDTLSGSVEFNYATQRYDEVESFGDGAGAAWVVPPIRLGANYAIPASHPGLLRAQMLDPTFGVGAMTIFQEGETVPYNSELDSFTNTDMNRIAFSLDGELSDNWQWHMDVTSANYDVDLALRDIVTDRYPLAINGFGGPNCGVTDVANPGGATPGTGSCFYYNPFMSSALPTSAGGIPNDPELIDWLTPNRVDEFRAKFYSADFMVTGEIGELAGGPIGLAVGAAFRHDQLSRDAAPLANIEGALAAVGFYADWAGEQDVNSVFFELALPLAENINVQIAARNEDYGDNISETTPKIAFNWTPTDDLTLRASYGTSFRGPSIVHSQATQIITGMNMRNITLGGMMYGMGGAIAFPYELRANPEVLPQTADNLSAGFDYDVGERISVGATWTQIQFEDRIASPTAPTVLNSQSCLLLDGGGIPILSMGDIQYVDIANGGCVVPFDANLPITADNLASVVGNIFNAGNLDAEFVDLRATMNFDPGNTSIRFTPSVTITTKYDFNNATNSVGVDNLCADGICSGIGRDINATTGMGGGFNGVTSMPRWQANFPVLWNINNAHSVRLNVNYRDGLNAEWNDLSPEAQENFQRDDGQWITNVSYNWRLPNDSTTISFLVNNLSATEPPPGQGARFNRRLREYGIQVRHSFDR